MLKKISVLAGFLISRCLLILRVLSGSPGTGSLSFAVTGVNALPRNLLHFAKPSFHTGQIVLHNLFSPLAEVFTQSFFDSRVDFFVGHFTLLGIGGQLEEHPKKDDTLHSHFKISHGSHIAGYANHVGKVDTQVLLADCFLMVRRDSLPHILRIAKVALHEYGAAIHGTQQRIATEQGCRIVQHYQIHILQFRVGVDMGIGNR